MIYLFGKVSDPKDTIKRVLRHADFYSAECMRDVRIAREWGFTGHVLPIFPNVGGFDIPAMRKYISSDEKTSSRRTIAVMGNQHFAGRPLTALDAICLCADELEKYKIRVYSATPDVELMVQLVATDYGLDIQCVPLPSPRAEILKLLGSARISIGIGISDGISTSFLEALILGSFPIQSNTASVNEWIVDGESGFIVSPIRSEEIAAKIKQALSDDSLVDNAGRINAQMADVKLAEERMKPTIKTMYDAIAKGASVEALHCEGRR